MKKEAVFVLASLVLLIGAGCERSEEDIYEGGVSDISVCNELEGEDKEFCIDNHYFEHARASGREEECEKIKDDVIKEVCLSYAT